MRVIIEISGNAYLMDMEKAAQVMKLMGEALSVYSDYPDKSYSEKSRRWINLGLPDVQIRTSAAPCISKEDFDIQRDAYYAEKGELDD